MEPNIPIPTDNIYKFIALFGLLIFISSGVSLVYSYLYFTDLLHKQGKELQILKVKTVLSQEEKITKDFLEEIVSIHMSNRRFSSLTLGGIAGIGGVMIFWGFSKWHKNVQPKQDQLLNLQIDKMKLEIQVLEKQLEKKDTAGLLPS